MKTLERLDLLLPVLGRFPGLGAFAQREPLLELLCSELGSVTALEDGAVVAPQTILHVMSGNTAMAGMQSLIRGLLLGARNWCKLPRAGLPELEEFIGRLSPELGALVERSRTLPEEWLKADAVIVFGSDETVEYFRQRVREDQIFAGYGHRWSGAVIFSDAEESVGRLSRDVGLYDQMGCLSAQVVFVEETVDARGYAERLAEGLAEYERANPRRELSLEENQLIVSWRGRFAWKAAMMPEVAMWTSPGSTAWTVVFDGTPELSLTPLFRSVLVKPFCRRPELGSLAGSLSTLGIWPCVPVNVERCAGWGASRICVVGEMQFPPPVWRQDGFPALGRLIRRIF